MKAKARKQMLLDVLTEAKMLISRPDNSFVWSGWDNASAALAEVGAIEEQITNNDFSRVDDLKIIFAPTGPMQELSIDSGWGQEFLDLAKRFDDTLDHP